MARIMVVDDDPTMRDLVTLVAEKDGHETFVAEDGVKATLILRAQPIDVLITDIMMPGIDGFGVVQIAREVQPKAHIIVASGVGEKVPEHLTEVAFHKLGVKRFIPKPYRASQLRTAIREALEE